MSCRYLEIKTEIYFPFQAGETTPRDKAKISKAQREIDHEGE